MNYKQPGWERKQPWEYERITFLPLHHGDSRNTHLSKFERIRLLKTKQRRIWRLKRSFTKILISIHDGFGNQYSQAEKKWLQDAETILEAIWFDTQFDIDQIKEEQK
jgi:hypothetical protein